MSEKPEATVWVVEQGSYSDYHVAGVFSTEERARFVADQLNATDEDGWHGEDATVSEWPLDPGIAEMNAGRWLYGVVMLRDGSVEQVRRWERPYYYPGGETTHRIWRRSEAPAYRGTDTQDALESNVWATDERHAVKIVNEKRIQMIASGEWS